MAFHLQMNAMTQTSTHDLLLLHLSGELSPAESSAFEHLLLGDAELQQDYSDFAAMLQVLEKQELYNPQAATMQLLLDYSRA